MSGDREPVFTFSPLLNREQAFAGLRLAVHPGSDQSLGRIAHALNDVVPVWPNPDVPIHVWLRGVAAGPEMGEWRAPAGAVLEHDPSPDDEHWLAQMNGHRPRLCVSLDCEASGDVIAVSAATLKSSAATLSTRVRRRPWVAIDIDDPMAFQASMHHGARSASGWAFMRQLPPAGSEPVCGAKSIERALEMLDREIDITELEPVMRSDAVLAFRVLAMANAASQGFAFELETYGHALKVLGAEPLKHWLASLEPRSENPSLPAWLQLSYMRGLFLERLGPALGESWNRHDLFLCGAFSLLDRIFRTPFENLFTQITVSEVVRDALIDRLGPLTPLMDVVYSLERGEPARVREKIALLALSPRQVNSALVEAFTTAQRCSFV